MREPLRPLNEHHSTFSLVIELIFHPPIEQLYFGAADDHLNVPTFMLVVKGSGAARPLDWLPSSAGLRMCQNILGLTFQRTNRRNYKSNNYEVKAVRYWQPEVWLRKRPKTGGTSEAPNKSLESHWKRRHDTRPRSRHTTHEIVGVPGWRSRSRGGRNEIAGQLSVVH